MEWNSFRVFDSRFRRFVICFHRFVSFLFFILWIGGPKSDIVLEAGRGGTGFLATTAEQYAEAMYEALTLDEKEARGMRQNSRRSATRFSDEAFDKTLERVLPLLYC